MESIFLVIFKFIHFIIFLLYRYFYLKINITQMTELIVRVYVKVFKESKKFYRYQYFDFFFSLKLIN